MIAKASIIFLLLSQAAKSDTPALGDEGDFGFPEYVKGLFEKREDLWVRGVSYWSKLHEAKGHIIDVTRVPLRVNGVLKQSVFTALELAKAVRTVLEHQYPDWIFDSVARRFEDPAVQKVHFRILTDKDGELIELPHEGVIFAKAVWQVQHLDLMEIDVTFEEAEKRQWTISLKWDPLDPKQHNKNRPTPYWPLVTPGLVQERIFQLSGLLLPKETLQKQITWIRTRPDEPQVKFSFNAGKISSTQQSQLEAVESSRQICQLNDSIFQLLPENRQLEFEEFSDKLESEQDQMSPGFSLRI